jgi:hypothetical protein
MNEDVALVKQGGALKTVSGVFHLPSVELICGF